MMLKKDKRIGILVQTMEKCKTFGNWIMAHQIPCKNMQPSMVDTSLFLFCDVAKMANIHKMI